MSMRDCILIFGALVGTPVALIIGLTFMWNVHSCTSTADLMGVPSSYSMATDCMVKIDGRWEPLNFQRSVRIKD